MVMVNGEGCLDICEYSSDEEKCHCKLIACEVNCVRDHFMHVPILALLISECDLLYSDPTLCCLGSVGCIYITLYKNLRQITFKKC
jgi:hypothetical protein